MTINNDKDELLYMTGLLLKNEFISEHEYNKIVNRIHEIYKDNFSKQLKDDKCLSENKKYTVRRHYNNEHTFEELFAHIIKSHS